MHTHPGPIVFDLDGTLLDTAPDLAAALNSLLSEEGYESIPLKEVRNMVGGGAVHMIKLGLARAGVEIEGDLPNQLRSRFLDHYRSCYTDQTVPFAGVVQALTELTKIGYPLSICTNKSEAMSVDIINKLGLGHFFSGIIGGDTLPKPKPDPGPVEAAIKLTGGRKDRAIMVGDSITDVKAARAANVSVIAVSFGYTEVAPADLGADAVIDHFDELIPTVKTVSCRKTHAPSA